MEKKKNGRENEVEGHILMNIIIIHNGSTAPRILPSNKMHTPWNATATPIKGEFELSF